MFRSNGVLLGSLSLALGALVFIGLTEDSLLATLSIWLIWGAVGSVLLALERSVDPLATPFTRQFWITFSLRVFVAVVLHTALRDTRHWPWWDFGAYGGDELGFWDNSERLVRAWQDGTILQEEALAFGNYFGWLQLIGFSRFLGAQLGGESVFNARVVLCMAGALIVPYVYALSLRLFDERMARVAALLAFWLPDYWFYSSTLMRDVLVSCVMAIVFYQLVAMLYGQFAWWRPILTIGLNFFVLRYLRGHLAYMNVALVVLFALWADYGKRAHLVPRVVLVGLFGLGVWGALSVVAPETYALAALSADRYSFSGFETSATVQFALALEEASRDSLGAELLRFPIYVSWPLSTLFLLVQPFPPWGVWGAPNMFPLKAIVFIVSATAWFGLAALLPVGFIACAGAKPRRTVWIWGTCLILAVAFGFGAAAHPRWRLMFMPFLLVLLARGMLSWREHRLLLRLTISSMATSLSVYTVLKYVS